MTEEPAVVAPVWVLDATCLSHFARAERLDVLRDLLVDKECWTTRVVIEELDKGVAEYPALQGVRAGDWLRVAELDTLEEVKLFVSWVGRTGSGERDLGEASVFATAELHGATAITDDREAVRGRPNVRPRRAWHHLVACRSLSRWQAIGTCCGEPGRRLAIDRDEAALHGRRVFRLRASLRASVGGGAQ